MKKIIILVCVLISFNSTADLKEINGISHNGREVTIKTSESLGTVLVFLSVKCPCSNSHIEEIKRLNVKFKEFKFVGIHSNYSESLKEGLKYFNQSNLNFPVIHDKDSSIAKLLGAVKTPHAYVINPTGKIIYRGGVTNRSNALKASKKYLEMSLSDIRSGKLPRVAERKTLGCYIALKD